MADTKVIERWLSVVAQQLMYLSAKEIEDHVTRCQESIESMESVGSLIDPTGYIKALGDGSIEDCKNQLEIAKHLLAARKAIDAREEFIKTLRGKAHVSGRFGPR